MSTSASHNSNYPTNAGVPAALGAFRAPGVSGDHP
jgi:hypothetical protein